MFLVQTESKVHLELDTPPAGISPRIGLFFAAERISRVAMVSHRRKLMQAQEQDAQAQAGCRLEAIAIGDFCDSAAHEADHRTSSDRVRKLIL